MKRMWVAAILVGLLCAVAATATEISIDYKRSADFTKYKTFAFQVGVPAANEAMDRHILAKIEALLTEAGLKKVDALEGADLHIIYSVAVSQGVKTEVVQLRQPLTGLPKWDYQSLQGSGGSTVNRTEYSEGTLVVDIEEGATSTLLWHGVATDTIAQGEGMEAAQKVVDSVLGLMLRRFPPKPHPVPAK